MSLFSVLTLSLLFIQTDDGLTFRELLADFPVDPASIVALALGLGFGGAVLYFGTRQRSTEGTSKSQPSPRSPGADVADSGGLGSGGPVSGGPASDGPDSNGSA
jgi:hypothetical protein